MKVREKNKAGRKGFTIVELVIVIGVIGVLSAVLIPTFIHLNAKAQTASDQSFVKNANTALGMSGKHDSMREAIAAVQEQAGLDVTTYKPVSGNHLIYDPAADRFAIVDDDAHLVYGDGDLKVSQPGEMLEVTDRFVQGSQKFGIYAGPEWDLSQTVIGTESAPLTVSFDAGEQDNIASIYFKRSSTAPAFGYGLIATGNNLECDLTIDAPADTIHHAGTSDRVHVIAVDDYHSYHEHGFVFQPIVIDAGHFVLESGSDVVVEPSSASVTVESKGGNSSTVSYPASALDPSDVTELRLPSFVAKFKTRVSNLDRVETIQTNRNPNRNTFYRNAEGTYDVYKVGNDNPLAFPMMAVTTDPVTLSERVFKNPTGVAWQAEDQDHTFYNSGNHTDILNYTNGNLVLGEGAIGKTFHFTASLNGKSVSFDFQGVDGYNVVDAKGLSLFDNSHYRDPDRDFWKQYKIDNGLASVEQPNALVLHNDITLKNTDFPARYFYTAEEIQQYFHDHMTEMSAFLSMKNALREQYKLPKLNEKEVMRMLTGSMKDDYPLYYRGTSGTEGHFLDNDAEYDPEAETFDFTFEGNYCTIDASHLKHVFFFGTRYQGTQYEKGTLSTQVFDGSHTTLFGINCSYHHKMKEKYSAELLLPERGVGGTNTFKNFTVIGNGDRSNNDDYQGAVFAFKVDATETFFANVNVSKTFTSFMTQCGDYKFTSNAETTFRTPTPVTHIDRCKSFDSYNSMLYIHGTNHNYITNSFMKGAGGGIMLLDEKGRQYENLNERTNGGYFTARETRVDCANVYFENYVSPTDVWFATHQASALVSMIGMNGTGSGWLKANADHAHGKIFTRSENGNALVNIIALDMTASAATGNTQHDLQGHVKIWDDADLLATAIPATVPSTLVADSAVVDVEGLHLLSGLDMKGFNTDDGVSQVYRMALNGNDQGIVFSDVSFDVDKIAMMGNGEGTVGIAIDPTKFVQKYQYSMDVEPFTYIPVSGYVDNLAAADYLGCYVKAAAGTKYLGLLLGQQ